MFMDKHGNISMNSHCRRFIGWDSNCAAAQAGSRLWSAPGAPFTTAPVRISPKQKIQAPGWVPVFFGGQGGIRTHEPIAGLPDFECCKTLADSRLEQVVPGRIVKSRKPRHRKEFRTFRPVSARGDLKCPRVQIKLRSCVKSRRSCAFARSQARKQRPRQHR